MATSFAVRLGMAGALSALVLGGPAAALEQLDVAVDRASIMRAPENMATMVIGNPLIADATTQKNGVLVITGKSFGSTNIMMLDAAGTVLSETVVNVRRAPDSNVVTIQRGAKRESFACNPRCEPALAIGDTPEWFGQTAGQITQRSGMSVGKTE
jgi:Flp pilus assembly secretin CpaC